MRTISSRGTFFVSGRRKKTKGMLMTVKQAKKLQDGLRERQSRRRTGARETGRKVRTCRRRTRPAPSPGTSSASHARWQSSLGGERASASEAESGREGRTHRASSRKRRGTA